MQPPPRGSAGRPVSLLFRRPDEQRNDRTSVFERPAQRRIIRQPQILSKPDKGGFHGVFDFTIRWSGQGSRFKGMNMELFHPPRNPANLLIEEICKTARLCQSAEASQPNQQNTIKPMKRLIALVAVTAFAFSAAAHCGNCGTDEGDGKPAVKCKCGKDCKGEGCDCGCHKKPEKEKE